MGMVIGAEACSTIKELEHPAWHGTKFAEEPQYAGLVCCRWITFASRARVAEEQPAHATLVAGD